jgi:hypothetical protein
MEALLLDLFIFVSALVGITYRRKGRSLLVGMAAILVCSRALATDLSPSARQLITAAEIGDAAQGGRLLDQGTPAGECDGFQRTALGAAAEQGHAATVELLLARGAKVEAAPRTATAHRSCRPCVEVMPTS